MKVIERSMQEIGKSLLITLPKSWADSFKLKKGSIVKIAIADKGNLVIAPEFTDENKDSEANIRYSDNFRRQFYKEYFQGNSRIKISNVPPSQRKEAHEFLRNFMNVQILEEKDDSILVKCFKIDDLSIEECLKRMHFLSLNMIDEALGDNDKSKLEDMEHSVTKFYYMLVMQVRRFIDEGKFTDQNQISLLRAMDYRMIAEKIERICDIIKTMDGLDDKMLEVTLSKIKDAYSKSFSHYINKNYQKALESSGEEKKLNESVKNLVAKSKTVAEYRKARGLQQIMQYSREISMLVR